MLDGIRILVVLRNVRRLKSKAWNKRTTNRALVSEVFGLGSTTANTWCLSLGIDPDANGVC